MRNHLLPVSRVMLGPPALVAACLVLLFLFVMGVPSRANDMEASPTLAACRDRIAVSAPEIDVACLRRIYALPIAEWPKPVVDPGVNWQELGPLPDMPPIPADNPQTPDKIALGKRLFDDPRLSRSGQIACASCHDRQLGWGDGRSVSFGHDRQAGKRNAMNVSMAGFAGPLFWDGRAASLEDQALHPIRDASEMAFTARDLEVRLNQDTDYPQAFNAVFGEPQVTMRRVAQALASYQRSLVPRHNRFDRFLEGRRDLLNNQQLRGLHLFRTQARCMNCHSGPTLSDNHFHNLGLHFFGRAREDLGRYRVTGDPADSGKFRTPSLRNVGRTGPYMHTGSFMELRGVINMYNAGMPRPEPKSGQADDPRFPQPDPLLKRLDLHRTELEALTEFLRTL